MSMGCIYLPHGQVGQELEGQLPPQVEESDRWMRQAMRSDVNVIFFEVNILNNHRENCHKRYHCIYGTKN